MSTRDGAPVTADRATVWCNPRVTELSVDQGRIFAEATGTGEPVLLLHAGVTDRRVWDALLAPLTAAGYRVIRYDMRGYGKSAPPTQPHSLVADALAVLDAAGVDAAHFVGLSQGAATSVDTALAQPARVLSLTLVAPGLSGFDWPALPGVERRMAAAEAGDAHALAVEIARLWAPLSFPAGQKSALPLSDDKAAHLVLDQVERFMRDELETEEPSAIPRLGEIGVPALVVLGDHDLEAIKRIGGLLAAGIPGARLVTLAGADHLLPLRVPEQLADLVVDHLSTTQGVR
jgi:3-oxoadipate enol-lactonase